MKKLFVFCCIALLALSITACSKKEEETLAGGWTEVEEELDEETLEIFNQAMEGMTGVSYEPIKLLGTQVVAGTNYRFLCNATTVTAEASTSQKVVTVYQDLEGNCEILEITDYNE